MMSFSLIIISCLVDVFQFIEVITLKKRLFVNFREKEEGRERETLICCSIYLCSHWLSLTHSLGVLGQLSNQLNNPARA